MIGFSSLASTAQAAVRGIAREFGRMDKAAEQIAQRPGMFSSGDRVRLSSEAVSAARTSESAEPIGLEQAMVDLRVAKYSAVANLRVLSTADVVTETLTGLMK